MVSADADGAVYYVNPGGVVVVSYYVGYAPSFSPGAPLCPTARPPDRPTASVAPCR
jgi:hypothetical protein